MVPCVGDHHLALLLAPYPSGDLVEQLLHDDRDHSRCQGDPAGTLQGLIQKEMLIDLLATLPEEANADTKENDPHEGGRQGLVFAMSILVIPVFRFGREPHEEQHHDVCHEVGEGVHGIGHHGATVPPYTGDKLENQQQEIAHRAQQGNPYNRLFSLIRRC